MAERVRPYLVLRRRNLHLLDCYRKVEGKIVFEDGKVLLLKQCPEHGRERVLIADDVDYYRRCREVFIKPPEMPVHYNTPVKWGCPYDCGLCTDHEQHSCLSLDRNLRLLQPDVPDLLCRRAGPSGQQFRTLDQIERMLDAVVRNEGRAGRRADLRRRADAASGFLRRSSTLAKARPIRHLMVNTNGVTHRRETRRSPSGWRATCRTSRSTCSSTRSSATR